MKKFYFLFISIILIGGAKVHSQTTVNILADKDNTIYSENNARSNGSGDYIFAGVTNAGNLRRALLHFDLSSFSNTEC
jgi:hypothetical protein